MNYAFAQTAMLAAWLEVVSPVGVDRLKVPLGEPIFRGPWFLPSLLERKTPKQVDHE